MLPQGIRSAAMPRVTSAPRCSSRATMLRPTATRPAHSPARFVARSRPRRAGVLGTGTSAQRHRIAGTAAPAPTNWRAGRIAARPIRPRSPNAYSPA